MLLIKRLPTLWSLLQRLLNLQLKEHRQFYRISSLLLGEIEPNSELILRKFTKKYLFMAIVD